MILIVEDNPINAHMLERMCRRLSDGEDVILCRSAEQAIETLERFPAGMQTPRVALVDMVLPGMSGAEFAAWLRARTPTCRIVAQTAYIPDAPVAADMVLSKPYVREEVAVAIGRVAAVA